MSALPMNPDAGAERRAAMLHSLRLSRPAPAPAPVLSPAPDPTSAPAAALAASAPATARRRLPAWAAVLLFLQAAGLVALALHGFGRDALLPGLSPAQAQSAAPLITGLAVPAVTAARFEASGFIAATRTATVSARSMGQVSEVLVEEGAYVKRGQVLARIDDEQARTELRLAMAQQNAARARVAAAAAQLKEAQRDFGREQSLRDQNFTSDARLGKAGTALDVAASLLAGAEADAQLSGLQVQRQTQQLEDHVIRAPFDGVVLARNAQVGEIVAPGGAGGGYTRTGIYTIVDMKSLEIVVDVNEVRLGQLQPGQKVQAELYANKGHSVAGEVLRVMPSADRAKSTVRVRVRLLEDDPRILPDMAVKVLFL